MMFYSYRDVRVQSFGLTCQDRCLVRPLSTSIMSILDFVRFERVPLGSLRCPTMVTTIVHRILGLGVKYTSDAHLRVNRCTLDVRLRRKRRNNGRCHVCFLWSAIPFCCRLPSSAREPILRRRCLSFEVESECLSLQTYSHA
jgi:hypothetical protein